MDSSSNRSLAPGVRPRQHPGSTYARFRRLSVDEIIRALDVVFDAHVAIVNAGSWRRISTTVPSSTISRISRFICAISTRIGLVPNRLDRARQYGSWAP
jgi:hypothetical protein